MNKRAGSNKSIRNPVRIVRNELELTQEQFAETLNRAAKYISMLETGQRNVSLNMARKISKVAKHPAPVEWLMGETPFRNDDERAAFESEVKIEQAKQKLKGIERAKISFDALNSVFEDAAASMGMSFKYFVDPEITNESILDYCERVPDFAKSTYLSFSLRRVGDGYDPDLDIVLESSSLSKLHKRLTHYAKFLLEEMIEEGEIDDGEH